MRQPSPFRQHRSSEPGEQIDQEAEQAAGSGGDPNHPTYTVGYGKPPQGSRFQPGRSGNPRGRPRGDLAFKTLLQQELEERVCVKEHGRRRKLSKRGVIVKRLVSEAMAGSPKHLAMVLAHDPIAAEVLDEVTAALARPADAAVKAELIRRLRAAAETDDAHPDDVDCRDGDGQEDGA